MANQHRLNVIIAMVLSAGPFAASAAAQPPRPKKAAEVYVKVDELKTIFKKHFNADLDVANYVGVSVSVNRWLSEYKRGEYAGYWNSEIRKDPDGNVVYGVVMIKPESVVDVKVEELKAIFRKQFNNPLDVKNRRGVSLAVNRWLTANKLGDRAGFWNSEEADDGNGNAVYGVVLVKPEATLDIKVEELKAVFKKEYSREMNTQDHREVGLAVNRWLMANRRGEFSGFWNSEEGDDGRGNTVYSIALIRRSADTDQLVYAASSTKRVCQLTGDVDRATGKPTLNQTGKRFGVEATDLGSSFEHKEKLYFLFGDTGPDDRDVMAWAKSTDPSKIRLDFSKGKDGKWLPLTVPGIKQGAFEVPSGGISIADTIYVVYTTDHTEKKAMGRSVLASSRDDGKTFKMLYELSRAKFINVSLWVANGWLYIYGSGEYRQSNVCLARVKPTDVGDQTKIQYFAGIGADGQPKWLPKEADAVPLFRHPQVGEFSVAYLDPVDRYVMLYNSETPRGITMRSARTPWGPWSAGTVVFEPWRDKGYGHFMHISAKFKEKRDALSDPKRDDEWGGEYGPYIEWHFQQFSIFIPSTPRSS